jgi:KDO2-lipid IV(A) lauroyltransferase
MSKFIDRFVVLILKLTARLPFPVLWGIADFSYVLLYYVFRYRRNVVMTNLQNSFPEKSQEELTRIAKKFYHHLSDLGLETVKFSRMSEAELEKRIHLDHPEYFEEYYQQGKSIVLLGMHYNNWEWATSFQRVVKAKFLVVYNPVRKNKALERFILDARERFGAQSLQVNLSVRTALQFNREARPSVLVLLADQTPPPSSQFWTIFLNQETGFFAGPMKIATKTNQPVLLCHFHKVGRSKYKVFLYKLVPNPQEVDPQEILMAYVRKLEEIIRQEPEYWLWSHRRWKHKRPENIELYQPEQSQRSFFCGIKP